MIGEMIGEMIRELPLPTEVNGRGSNGKFLPGNRIAKGNPAARRAQQLRFSLMNAVTPDDMKRIVAKLIRLAEEGDVQAAKLIMDRVLGPPVPLDIEERISQMEAIVGTNCERQESIASPRTPTIRHR